MKKRHLISTLFLAASLAFSGCYKEYDDSLTIYGPIDNPIDEPKEPYDPTIPCADSVTCVMPTIENNFKVLDSSNEVCVEKGCDLRPNLQHAQLSHNTYQEVTLNSWIARGGQLHTDVGEPFVTINDDGSASYAAYPNGWLVYPERKMSYGDDGYYYHTTFPCYNDADREAGVAAAQEIIDLHP